MFRLVCLLCFAFAGLAPAGASVTHKVKFGQGPLVLVWQDAELVGRGEAVTLDREAAPAPRDTWLGGGLLEPISYTSDTDLVRIDTLTFASNAPVTLRFDSQPLNGTLEARLIDVGIAAQYDGPSRIERDYTFGDSTTVLNLPTRTALKPGSPANQSITLEIVRTGEAAALPLIMEARDQG
ncbi:MAG: hypothetical protein AAGH90_03630 [Pseudomonadota bacterium]